MENEIMICDIVAVINHKVMQQNLLKRNDF